MSDAFFLFDNNMILDLLIMVFIKKTNKEGDYHGSIRMGHSLCCSCNHRCDKDYLGAKSIEKAEGRKRTKPQSYNIIKNIKKIEYSI